MALLGPWANFYVIVGSAAAALTGLVFIVITLVTGDWQRRPSLEHGVATFTSPTVLHFGSALYVALGMAAPWHALGQAAIVVGAGACYSVYYSVGVLRRMWRIHRNPATYTPDAADWTWYVAGPLLAYLTLLGAAITLVFAPEVALPIIAGAVVLTVFIGIHNAWDVVTFVAAGPDDPDDPPA